MIDNPSHTVSPRAAGFVLAASVAFIANTLLVWAKEISPALKGAMKAALGHHWTTHGIFIVLLFITLGLVFSRMPLARRIAPGALAMILVISAAFGVLGIASFFLLSSAGAL